MQSRTHLKKLILSAFFLALSFFLPFLFGQIPEIGSRLSPMHLPPLLCGFLCGGPWGLAVGLLSPLLRSLLFTMPPLFPTAVCMAFELATYGFVAGFLHRKFPHKKPYIFCSLILSMLVGRAVWGIAMYCCMTISGNPFTFAAFLAGAFTKAVPAIILQLCLVPLLVAILDNPKVLNLDQQR